MRYSVFIFFMLSLFLTISQIFGQDNDSFYCGSQFLESVGYSVEHTQIKLQWKEYTKKGYVYGFLVTNMMDGIDEEIYFDGQGNLLTQEDLKSLRVSSKNWGSGVVSIPTVQRQTNEKRYKQDFVSTENILNKKIRWKHPQYSFDLPVPDSLNKNVLENAQEKGPLEIGQVISLDAPVSIFGDKSNVQFARDETDDYQVYSINFYAYNALGIKLQLVLAEQLPVLHRLYVMSMDSTGEILPVEVEGDEVWTPLVFSSEATLFYVFPKSSSLNTVPVMVKQYAYIYKDPLEELAKLGTCYEDVMCYEPWSTLSKGVVGIVRISSPSIIYCTGSLLNDGNDEQISQLILTAYHCVNSQSSAGDLEFVWMYQSESCKGVVPDITTVPRTTGGAEFLVGSATDTGTDMSFLRMKNTPPPNVLELGFTNGTVSVGTDIVAIHHPGRSYKRISFGKTTDTGSPSSGGQNLRPLDRYFEVIYALSSTESGSSGCPLFRADTQQIIGQLWGGNASCLYMNEPDYYGRFDVSYPLIEPYLYTPPNIYDVDDSGVVDNDDLKFVINSVLGINSRIKTDLNNDGRVDAMDIQIIRNQLQKIN